MSMQTNEKGQIVGDTGILWSGDKRGFASYSPYGYFIERLGEDRVWTLFRKTRSSYPEKVPFVRQILVTGRIKQCMFVAEMYEIRRVF